MHPLPIFAAAPLRRTVAHTRARLFARALAGASLAISALVAAAPAYADSRNMLPRNELAAYTQECAACHGRDGMGRGKFPRLVGQYTAYLKRQIEAFVKGERPHDEVTAGGILNRLAEAQHLDMLAYLTSIQGAAASAAKP